MTTKSNKSASSKHLNVSSPFFRHPSAVHLEEEQDEDHNNEQNQLFTGISVTSIQTNNTNSSNNNCYQVNVSNIPHEICNKNNNFYIKSNNTSNITLQYNHNNNNSKNKKNLMTPHEIKFDAEITKCIQEGQDYSNIENKFDKLLKK